MKATKVLARTVSHAFAQTNISPELAFALLNGPGVYRGAHNLDAKDFESYRVDQVTGHDDDVLTYTTVSKEGKALDRSKASLLVSAEIAKYEPYPGEYALVKGVDAESEDDAVAFFPVIVNALHHETGFTCAGLYEGEPWADDFEAINVMIPTTYIGQAGLLSRHQFEHCFNIPGATNVSVDELGMVDARLAESGLTFRDLIDYMLTPTTVDASQLKFAKKVMKKHKVTDEHDILHFMKTGDLVLRQALVEEQEASQLEQFAEDVAGMGGAKLKELYATVCKLARVKEDARQTAASKVKAHIIQLVTEARLKNLIKAGAYEAHDADHKAAA